MVYLSTTITARFWGELSGYTTTSAQTWPCRPANSLCLSLYLSLLGFEPDTVGRTLLSEQLFDVLTVT